MLKVFTDQLPARVKGSFFNQTYAGLLGKDRACVEGVIGRPVSVPDGKYGINPYVTNYISWNIVDEVSVFLGRNE